MLEKLVVGVTDCQNKKKQPIYINWLNKSKFELEIIELSKVHKNQNKVINCDCLILTGGVDIHPKFYNKSELIDMCESTDEERDIFELEVISLALDNNKPIFGICRGAQLINIAPPFYGEMFPDIPSIDSEEKKKDHSTGELHKIKILKNTNLYDLVGKSEGEVNTYHHQCVTKVGKGLISSSHSEDGVLESFELEDKNSFPYIFLVQWHPERMDFSSPFSGKILENFFERLKK